MALVTAYCRGYGAIRRGFHPYASSLDEAPYLWRVRKRKREDGIGFSAHTVRVVVKGICVTPSRPCCAVQTPFKLSQAVSKKINVSSRAFTSKDRDLHPFPLFDDMEDLDETLKAALKRQQLDQMTEVQALTWDAAMDDKDVVARSRTGSGKTIAFLLPGIQQIINEQQQHSGPAVESPNNGVRMLILSPTRELARQIHRQSQLLTSLLHDGQGTRTECNCQVVYGGTSKQLEIESMIQQIPHVLSATPGRLLDHIGSSYVANQPFRNLLSNTKLLVLDEADRMLDMGFRDDIRNIISFLPHTSERQTMLFSATMPTQVREMVDLCIRRDLDQRTFIDCTSGDRPTLMEKSHINHTHVLLPRDRIVSGVVQVILHMMKKRKKDYKIIVFCPTTSQVKFFSRLFNQGLGRQVLDIHSGKGQVARTVVSDRFRHAKRAVMFSTDVSARGVDYPDVTCVVQLGLPGDVDTYIHRVGRTGRGGKKGDGVLVLLDVERPFLRGPLQSLDICPNDDLQAVLDGPIASQLQCELDRVHLEMRLGQADELKQEAESVYKSLLRFYHSKLTSFGQFSSDDLVEITNSFARQSGLVELPVLSEKIAKQCGVYGHPGISVRSTWSPGNHFDVSGRRSKKSERYRR